MINGTCTNPRSNHGKGALGMILFAALALAIAVVTGALLGGYTKGRSFTESVFPPFSGKRVVNILMLGEDNTGLKGKQRGLSDTIILLHINLDTNQIAALSIPRDTRVDLSGYGGECKINAANKIGGPTLTAIAVESITGVKPDFFLKTNLDGFKKTVDLLGGVTIDVEKDMHYTDHWGKLYINLHKGEQLLNGENAMGYVRFRHDKLGDITRMQRQQRFVTALAKKAVSPMNLTKLPQVMDSVRSNMETDLSVRDMVFLAQLAKKVNMSQLKTATLPAAPQRIGDASYMIQDTEASSALIQELFFTQIISGLPKVEVLNGSGISGAAQRVAEALKKQGYNVLSTGNADAYRYESSEISIHKDNIKGLDAISSIVNSGTIKREINPSSKAEVTVIVGRDCTLANSQ